MHDDKQGRKMNIDLDSWEAGYADGQYGRSPQCAIGLDLECAPRAGQD